ncbi:MAG: hypothetical protein QM775_22925 [Pirellulales bacterium]
MHFLRNIHPAATFLAFAAFFIGCDSARDDYQRPATAPPAAARSEPWSAQVVEVRQGRRHSIVSDVTTLDETGRRELGELVALRELQLPQAKVGDEFVGVLKSLPKLEVLVLGESTIGGRGWDAIVELRGLKRLNLASCEVDDAALSKLLKLAELESLRLGSRRITDAGLTHVARLPKLRHLIIRYAPITDAGVVALAKLPWLESLYLEGTQVSEVGERELLKRRPDLHLHFP